MRTQPTRFAGMLVIGATILLISIVIGTRLGDRVIVAADGRNNDVAVDLPTPVPMSSATIPPSATKWKSSHVVAVATDPAFPDPRITPTPEPTPTPTPKVTSVPKNGQPNSRPSQSSQPALPSFSRANNAGDPYVNAKPKPTDPPKRTAPRTSDELGE